MELDELKKSWNALDEQLKKEPIADEKQIAGMIAEYKANARKSIGRLTGWQRFSIGIGVVGLALLLVIWLLPSIFQINEEWQPKINTLVIFVGISILLGIWWDHKNYRWIRNTKIDEMPVAIVGSRESVVSRIFTESTDHQLVYLLPLIGIRNTTSLYEYQLELRIY